MPIRCTIDHVQRSVLAEAEAPLVLQDILAYLDRLVVEGAMPYPKLFDVSTAKPQLSDQDVMVLGARVSAYAAFAPRGPLAIVARSDEAREAVRRFMNVGRGERPAMMFDSIKAAREWLDEEKEK